MSDPAPIHLSSSSTPVESHEDEESLRRSTPLLLTLILGLFKLAGVVLVVYLTYFFTTLFAHRTPPAAPLTDDQLALAKKAEDLHAQGKKVLSSYGWADPVTKSKVHIPIDRAMELLLAESSRPLAPAAAPVATVAKQGTPVASAPAAFAPGPAPAMAASPTAAPAPSGMSAEQLYRMVCMACHDGDGRGKIVKLAMPSIPDLTDPKFQASRTDPELTHSILEGKESTVNGVKIPLMLSMKDKLALAHTDVKDMVAFMRAFKGGKQVVSATPSGSASAVPPEIAQALAPAVPAAPAPVPAAVPAPSTVTSPSAASLASVGPNPTTTTARPTAPSAATQPAPAPATTAPGLASASALPPALPVTPSPRTTAANTAAVTEKLRAAGNIFGTLCIACHGPDGRGTLVRVAMPAIPDFTSRDWQASRTSGQLATSILEGKGTLMVPWNTRLTPEQARSLVLYVRNIGGADLLAAETQEAPGAGPSLAEFDNKLRTLRQQFDEIERQLQTLPAAPAR